MRIKKGFFPRFSLILLFILIIPTFTYAMTHYYGERITIPFSQPINPGAILWRGWPAPPPSNYSQGYPQPMQMRLLAPASGTLIVRLSVSKADWDIAGVYQTVPIGMSVNVYSPPYDRQGHVTWRDSSGWVAATGQVNVRVRKVREGDTLHITFSTLAPGGALGLLEILKP